MNYHGFTLIRAEFTIMRPHMIDMNVCVQTNTGDRSHLGISGHPLLKSENYVTYINTITVEFQ